MKPSRVDESVLRELKQHVKTMLQSRGRQIIVGAGDSLVETLGLDSLQLFELSCFVGEHFNIPIGAGDVVPENFGTLEAVAQLVAKKRSPGAAAA
ncbi:MAG: acyl carrier protein [Fuerstiella sp.]|nr:acyl carrier protein [Fuerstiella sp.]